ncbi:hypothetical protein NUU61_000615 [Penicillium alfredii]|uniref:Pectinesterase n=1 Tax=Penicillium alfredii TaxID=1506179 RepID=A0A9W9KR65_9EURO|nr:uncharacterized protein NUU61_000615 [Penicillium alfredii]KAJ5114856.1 hypothetical protein NUU61_000615 [Penicillium alfredii]
MDQAIHDGAKAKRPLHLLSPPWHHLAHLIFLFFWCISPPSFCCAHPVFTRLLCTNSPPASNANSPLQPVQQGHQSSQRPIQQPTSQPSKQPSTPCPTTPARKTILILAGEYTEQLNVTRAGPFTLLGQIRSGTGTAATDASQNQVRITWAAANHDNTGQSIDNVFTSVLVVAPTLEVSLTGSGTTGYVVPTDTPFWNRDFSRIYVGKLANAYFYHSIIAGQADFLYGSGTAWKGTNTTTTFENKYGVYIVDSGVRAANSSIAAEIRGGCALGRP